MKVVWWPDYCGNSTPYQAFWHDDIMVNTSMPDLTDCFRDTALTWMSSGCVLLGCPIAWIVLRSVPPVYSEGPRGWLFWSKTTVLTLLGLFRLLILGFAIHHMINSPQTCTPSIVVAIALRLLAVVFTILTVFKEFHKGLHTSGLFSLTYILMVFTEGATVWSYGHRWTELIETGVPPWKIIHCITGFSLTLIFWLLVLKVDKAVLRYKFDRAVTNKQLASPSEKTPLLWPAKEKEVVNSSQGWDRKAAPESPESRISFFNSLFSFWNFKFVFKCIKREVDFEDVYEIQPRYQCGTLIPRFFYHWDRGGDRPDLLFTLARCFGGRVFLSVAVRLGGIATMILQPIILKQLLSYIQSGDEHLWKGILFSVCMLLCNIISGIGVMWASYTLQSTGMAIKSCLTAAIFRKILRLSNQAKMQTTVGQIVNFISVDGQRIQDTMINIQPMWTMPLVLVVTTFFLWQDLSVISLVVFVMVGVIMIPFNGFLVGRAIQKLQYSQMWEKDKRLRLLSEMFGGVKILKLYAWENGFLRRLTSIREKELITLTKSNMLFGISSVLWNALTNMVIMLMYAFYVVISVGNVLTPDLAFVTQSFVQIMQTPASFFTSGISYVAQSLAAIDRINEFLLLEENTTESDPSLVPDKHNYPIQIKEASFSWLPDGEEILRDIDLTVRKGSLIAVVGQVGSGKSSLISAILLEMTKTQGKIFVEGSVASVPQLPWIQNRTLRNNILMNKPFKQSLYDNVINACALRTDLDILVDGDQTEIGQKGINLSGGQKQRVSLARAVYQNKDIYLFDDPLSAVDSHVAKHLFEKVIGPTGVLKHKTRILVTNNVTYLPEVDYILMLDAGRVIERGTFAQLIETNGNLASFVKGFINENDDDEETGSLKDAIATLGMSGEFSLTRFSSLTASKRQFSKTVSRNSVDDKRLPRHVLVKEEVAETGAVIKLANFQVVFSAVPRWLGFGVAFFYASYTASLVLGNIQLSSWTSMPFMEQPNWSNVTDDNLTPEQHFVDVENFRQQKRELIKYSVIVIAQVLTNLFASLCLAGSFIRASRVLHSNLLSRVFHAPMSFFDTTPIGRILNRLSRDIDILDFNIPAHVRVLMMYTTPLIAIFISVAYTNVFFLVVLVPLIFMFGILLFMNVCTIRHLRRLESIRLSPLLVHFDDAVSGISSIKAYGLNHWFIDNCDYLTDKTQNPVYMGWITRRWCGIMLTSLGGIVVFMSAILSVLMRATASSGDAGMAISVSMQAFTALTAFVNSVTELNSFLVSLERIKEYTEVPQEVQIHGSPEAIAHSWPQKGRVQYQGYSSRYRPGLDLALNQLDLDVQPGQKVAVVGRTGAGKSSLSLALFRIFDAAAGKITIDGVDISKVELNNVRGRLTIIPQDPVVFTGSLRLNLDPYDQYTDMDIWTSLNQAHLGPFVRALPTGLQYECGDGGESLSLGQRQLLCLARALLRQSRVLILDEATAAVDPETDELIQATIRKAFWQCTIITIAHRLTTILDYDRIGVMDHGKLIEYNSPNSLLADPNSVFFGMAKAAGIVNEHQDKEHSE